MALSLTVSGLQKWGIIIKFERFISALLSSQFVHGEDLRHVVLFVRILRDV